MNYLKNKFLEQKTRKLIEEILLVSKLLLNPQKDTYNHFLLKIKLKVLLKKKELKKRNIMEKIKKNFSLINKKLKEQRKIRKKTEKRSNYILNQLGYKKTKKDTITSNYQRGLLMRKIIPLLLIKEKLGKNFLSFIFFNFLKNRISKTKFRSKKDIISIYLNALKKKRKLLKHKKSKVIKLVIQNKKSNLILNKVKKISPKIKILNKLSFWNLKAQKFQMKNSYSFDLDKTGLFELNNSLEKVNKKKQRRRRRRRRDYYIPFPRTRRGRLKANLRAERRKYRHFLAIAHVLCTNNNTLITITDIRKKVLCWSSAGSVGFTGTRRGLPYAAQVAGSKVARKVRKQFKKTQLMVIFKGIGKARRTALKGLKFGGLKIIHVKSATPIPHNGCRSRKQRRL